MAKAQNVKTTTTSKWVFKGTGTFRDLIPMPPPLKLFIDLLFWLAKKPILLTLFITGVASAIATRSLIDAILILLLVALLLAAIKAGYNTYITGRRNKRYQKISNTTRATVPLDKNNAYGAYVTLDRSTLIGGEAGSGKSNLVWHIISQLNEFDIPYRLHVIDPAGGVELSDLEQSPYMVNYVDRPQGAEKLINNMRKDMDQRLDYMKQSNTRKHVPTTQDPLNILVIDELLLLPGQLKDITTPLAEMLAIGRKASFIVIACTQLGQVDSIGRVRDLFPQRVCFAVRTDDMTDAILGTGATKDGAEAHLLTRPGEGYVFTEDAENHSKYFYRFRAPLVTDTLAVAKANPKTPRERLLPPIPIRKPTNPWRTANPPTAPLHLEQPTYRPDLTTRRTAVYQLYANDGTAMYTGVAVNPNNRLKQHRDSQAWFTDVDLSKTVITWYPNRGDALNAEKQAIKAYRPIYNIVHNFGND